MAKPTQVVKVIFKKCFTFQKGGYYTPPCIEQKKLIWEYFGFLFNKPLIVSEHWSGYQNPLSLSKN